MTGAFTLFYRSTVGKKVVMAVSGLIGVGFIVAHMIGNLKIFQGQQAINDYGHFLREVGYPLLGQGQVLWLARIVLLAAIIAHVVSAYQLSRQSYAARPRSYGRKGVVQASYASRTMRWGGIIILLFVVYHILHFTTGAAHGNFAYGDVYNNVVYGFQNPLAAGFYIVAMVALAFHLYHGAWSMFQTLGLNNHRYNAFWRYLSVGIAVVVAVGNISIPLAVLLGFLQPAVG
jgi:succinate dehydrogenase / fumarate reductase, cytochrome b subunit